MKCDKCGCSLRFTLQDEIEAAIEFRQQFPKEFEDGSPLGHLCEGCYDELLSWMEDHR